MEQISDGRVRLRAGTLYTALERLSADRLIEVGCEEIVDNRLRRYYHLTPTGEERLSAEAVRLRSNRRRLRPPAALTEPHPTPPPKLRHRTLLNDERAGVRSQCSEVCS